MPVTRKLTGKQLGSKIKELFKIIETTPNWEHYVSNKTERIVKIIYEKKNMTETLEILNMKYVTVYKQLERALERIKTKQVNYLRQGQSNKAQYLFKLMENPNWEKTVTEQEALIAKTFKEKKNFYVVAEELDLLPGNIAATLYGNKHRISVTKKLEKIASS
jgi:hypothetical protein